MVDKNWSKFLLKIEDISLLSCRTNDFLPLFVEYLLSLPLLYQKQPERPPKTTKQKHHTNIYLGRDLEMSKGQHLRFVTMVTGMKDGQII